MDDKKFFMLETLYDDILNDQDFHKTYEEILKVYPDVKQQLLDSVEVLIVNEAVKLENEGKDVKELLKLTHKNIKGGSNGRK